ncbi:MAG: radical SAM protein [Deltaproteobacteria bacterium]|nr:radical SAM protein [Deltaproteobacteria bacterium]
MKNLAAQFSRIPHFCVWEITGACNMRCSHCETDSGKRVHNELTTKEALMLADDLAAAGCKVVNLAGGEPLIRKDWRDIAGRLVRNGIEVGIVTNGIALNEKILSQLLDIGVNGVSVSLDGEQEAHDMIRKTSSRTRGSAHAQAINAVELLSASSLKTAVITQVNRASFPDLDLLYERLATLRIDNWQIQLAMPLGRTLELEREYLLDPAQIPELLNRIAGFIEDGRLTISAADNLGYYSRHEPLLRQTKERKKVFWTGCMAGIRSINILPGGDVKGCPAQPSSFVVGNVHSTPLAELWSNKENFAYNTNWNEDLLEGKCAECAYRRLCRAGCTAMAYAVTGTIYDNPFCFQRTEAAT